MVKIGVENTTKKRRLRRTTPSFEIPADQNQLPRMQLWSFRLGIEPATLQIKICVL